MKFYYYLFLIVFITSCKTKTFQSDRIPEINIKSESLLKNTDIFMKYPYKIKVKDSTMCIWDLHGGEKFFHLYSFPDLKFITSFGINGRGAEEFICTGGFYMDNKQIYVFDTHRALLYTYLLDSLRCKKNSPSKIVHYPTECAPILGFTKSSNGFILLNYDGKNRITIVDSTGNIISKKYELPIPEKATIRKHPEYISSLWDSEIAYSPEKNIISIVTKLGEVLEIYDIEKDSSNIVIGRGNFPDLLKQGNRLSIGKIDGYFDIQIKGDLIYTIFSGADREELSKQWAKGINTPSGGNLIYIYDLKGNLIKKYKLDQYINGFDVHDDEGIIYTISTSSESSISKYRY